MNGDAEDLELILDGLSLNGVVVMKVRSCL
jgi:hypothetical protein